MAKKKQKKQVGGQQYLSEEQFIRQRIRQLPLDKCYITNVFEQSGTNHIIVTRRHTGGRLSMAAFMVDRLCVGVKESFYRLRIEDYDMDDILHGPEGITFRECSYEEAHNRIYGAIAFAEEGGIKPHKSFNLTQYFLEEDTDDVPLIEYEFGVNGKHVLVCDSQMDASQYLPLLRKHLGEDGFKYLNPLKSAVYADNDHDNILLTMEELVTKMKKNDLISFSVMMGFEVDAGQDIDEMRKHYIEEVKKHSKRILMLLPENEIFILKEIRNDSSKLYDGVRIPFDYSYTILERLGLGEGDWDELGYYYLYVAEDFAELVMPLLDEVDKDEGYRAKSLIETVVEGMANLYGEVSLAEVKQVLKETFNIDDEKAGVLCDAAFSTSLLMRIMLFSFGKNKEINDTTPDDEIFFVSRYHWEDVKAQHHEIQKRSAALMTASFATKEIVAATTCPLPSIPNKTQERFVAFLKSIIPYNDDDVKEICFNIWYRAQHEYDNSFQQNSTKDYFLHEVINKDKSPRGNRDDNEAMTMLKEYLDYMPRWTLRGHSHRE